MDKEEQKSITEESVEDVKTPISKDDEMEKRSVPEEEGASIVVGGKEAVATTKPTPLSHTGTTK